MNYADVIVARLADPAARAAIFDEAALGCVLAAAYEEELLAQPPFAAVFEELRLGLAAPGAGTLAGTWCTAGGADRTEALFTIAGLAEETAVADALWRGAIGASIRPPRDTISAVESAWPAPDRAELTMTFSPPDATPPTTRPVPVVAAILVRGVEEFSLRALLQQSKTARARLVEQGYAAAPARGLPTREPLTLIWIVPPELFDDAGWPGADADARRAHAASWLAAEGIALVTAPGS